MNQKIKNAGEITSIAKVRYVINEQDLLCPAVEEPPTSTQTQNLSHKTFRVHLADTEDDQHSASILINKMYSWRGYTFAQKTQENPNKLTLTASEDHKVIGTVSLSIDSPAGLLADEIFSEEVDLIRKKGGKVCEFTNLAFDHNIHLKHVLASIFHVAVIYVRHIHKCSDLFIEVNPRHQRYYEKMLGFKQQGTLKTNLRVNAPAILLWLDLDYCEHQIRKLGGTSNKPVSDKSFYPYFFSHHEEMEIIKRITQLNKSGSGFKQTSNQNYYVFQ